MFVNIRHSYWLWGTLNRGEYGGGEEIVLKRVGEWVIVVGVS